MMTSLQWPNWRWTILQFLGHFPSPHFSLTKSSTFLGKHFTKSCVKQKFAKYLTNNNPSHWPNDKRDKLVGWRRRREEWTLIQPRLQTTAFLHLRFVKRNYLMALINLVLYSHLYKYLTGLPPTSYLWYLLHPPHFHPPPLSLFIFFPP